MSPPPTSGSARDSSRPTAGSACTSANARSTVPERRSPPVRDIGWLFERLHKFWHPPTTVIAQHSTEHTRVYSTIMERVRTIPHLAFLDHTLFDGLPSTTLASIGGAPLSPADERSEFYVINSMIQLMEDVYADLHLEDNFDHPHVEGWMAVFRRWAMQEAFQRTWAISRCTYAERFRRFYDDRLVKRRIGRRPADVRVELHCRTSWPY